MSEKPAQKVYRGKDIDVTYDYKRCTHAAECVSGLPMVFNTRKRPWVDPDKAEADRITEVVLRCPTGALHFTRKDGGIEERSESRNLIILTPGGPLYLRGDLRILDAGGDTLLDETRAALCRCGNSRNKPFCDNSHIRIGFGASGVMVADEELSKDFIPGGRLHVQSTENGPILVDGNFEIMTAGGEIVYQGTSAALCRCGGSGNKPFCDGTHRRIKFGG